MNKTIACILFCFQYAFSSDSRLRDARPGRAVWPSQLKPYQSFSDMRVWVYFLLQVLHMDQTQK